MSFGENRESRQGQEDNTQMTSTKDDHRPHDSGHQMTSREEDSSRRLLLHPSLSREGNIVKSLLSVNDEPWDSSVTSVPDAVCRSLLRFQHKHVMVSSFFTEFFRSEKQLTKRVVRRHLLQERHLQIETSTVKS